MKGIKNQVVIIALSPLTPTLSRWRGSFSTACQVRDSFYCRVR